jgi:predicted MFS family arabinose efflux permease
MPTMTPMLFAASAGVIVGIAQAGTTYAIIFGVIGRNIDASKRSWAMGVAAAAGSFGQFLMVPVENTLINGSRWFGATIEGLGWQGALFALAATALVMIPLAFGVRERWLEAGVARPQQSIGAALREAFGYRSFQLLMAGYFVCGFQVVFIGVHLPSYLKDNGLTPDVATTALALIGLFNVFGTYAAGSLGQRWPKRHLLSGIYALRSVVIVAFLAAPLTPWSVYLFAAAIGFLWLSTVPPTNAVIAQIFGVQYLSMLGGFVFLSHQVGSFLGAWLGGKLYDATGSYDVVWWLAVALGIFAALINLPVREGAIARTPTPAGAAA